jgi:drug/metabolite transporter (DMT)-like permease
MRQVIGILLIIFGVAYIVFQGFNFGTEENVTTSGPLTQVNRIDYEGIPYSPIVGGVIIAGGAVLLLLGARRYTV